MAQNRFQKDDEIGKLQIPFENLTVNTLHEEWYPLVSPSSIENDEGRIVSAKEGEFGAVRLKITLNEEKLLPMSCYSKLLSVFFFILFYFILFYFIILKYKNIKI